ncbi:ADP-ribose pyrophosphatase YjhB (NUDIX family) [Sediminihabitans luteus]|uniref:ADP-ribose pyrophosphatase YjhB (NUDIX family) n=1 Tax=Sediminihabitans luteus TaxID=1138585 RepID=A0A2M9CYE8_9CELL|nr:NUDIX hydrolase [Sediminihabitans luteus]PJJ76962.1 ADP-ribose pyrophosphatase YjhB (NUDIX family) [Sediminihabitans luteus]
MSIPTVPDPSDPAGPRPRHLQPGDGWVECVCGRRHWGLHGAAGLLLGRLDDAGRLEVVLQHRAPWSDQGGTWGVPGGAVAPDETATQGALRETSEEAGVDPDDVVPFAEHLLDHGPWRYTTVLATVRPGALVLPRPADAESVDVRWVAADDVTALPLLPAFAQAWPGLRERLEAATRPSPPPTA